AGVYPRDATTTIRPDTLEIMQRSGVYGFVVDNEYVKPDPGLQPMPSGLTPDAKVLWIRRHGWEFSYEAFQPPFYYVLALPVWFAGHAIGGALGSLYAVRIFAALLSKTSAIGIAPALVVALLQTRRDGGVRPLLIAGAVAAACVAPWLASNVAIYGELITTREQLAMAAFPARTVDPGFWSVSTLHAFVTFWTGDPFLSVPGAVALAILAAFISALAAAGVWRA